MEFKAFDYQQDAINFLLPRNCANAFLPMGSGKTATCLETLRLKAQQNLLPPGHILVVAPKNIARSTWPIELESWDQFKGIKQISLIEKPNGVQLSKKKRDEIIDNIPNEKPSIYFINRELFPYLVNESLKRFKGKWLFPTIIIDELQSFKSYSSQRFKALKKILPQCYVRIGLTGTPCAENLEALWAETYFLDEGKRLGRNITQFRKNFFFEGRRTPAGHVYEYIPKPGAQEEITNLISDCSFSINLPKDKKIDAVTIPIKYKMSEKEQKIYKKLLKEKILNEDSENQISADNAAVLASKLLQCSSGAIYLDDDTSKWETIHELKLDMIEDIVDHEQGNPILLFYWYNHEKVRLLERLNKKYKDVHVFKGSKEEVEKWNQGRYKILLLHPASAGHGLNLQYGGYVAAYYTLPWSYELYAQSRSRLIRTGQKNQVLIYQCLIQGTIDEKIVYMLSKKEGKQQQVLNDLSLNPTFNNNEEDKTIEIHQQSELDELVEILTEIKNEA